MNKKEAQEEEWSSIYPSVSLVHHTPSSSFLSAGASMQKFLDSKALFKPEVDVVPG